MSDEDEECVCPPGLPAWMGTFADLMSLLMCFFVLLLSFSEMDALKFKRLAGSMAQAFGVQSKLNVTQIPKGTSIIAQEFSPGRPESTPINEIWQQTDDLTEMSLEVECSTEYSVEQGEDALDGGVKARIKEKLEALLEETQSDAFELAEALSEQILTGQIEVETRGRLIIIRIREKGAFPSGSADISPEYKEVMSEVKSVLSLKPGRVEIQGHTDNVPINTFRFRSNWALSAARAVSVAHELMRGGDIPAKRFEVSGFADTKPLAPNTTPDNKARNRRVEILIKQGLADELSKEDIDVLKENQEGEDILRELDIAPKYLFDLSPEEIF